jgi:hypothetical protein
VDAEYVYWNRWNIHEAFLRISKAGGTPTPLGYAFAYPGSFAIDATHLYAYGSLHVNGRDASGFLWKIPLEGGEPILLASVFFPGRFSLALDQDNVYWSVKGATANNHDYGIAFMPK